MQILYSFNIMGIPSHQYDKLHFFTKLFYSFICFFDQQYCKEINLQGPKFTHAANKTKRRDPSLNTNDFHSANGSNDFHSANDKGAGRAKTGKNESVKKRKGRKEIN
jgi:hypothetical protein